MSFSISTFISFNPVPNPHHHHVTTPFIPPVSPNSIRMPPGCRQEPSMTAAHISASSPSLPPFRPPSLSPASPKWNLFQRLAAATLDAVEHHFISNLLERSQPLPKTLDPAFQISGNFSPVVEHPPRPNLPISGKIPPTLFGIYLRNGPNPFFPPLAGHHLFDGDGMLHAVLLHNNQASYSCRFTQTHRFLQERAFGRPLFPKAIGELHGHSGIARLLLFFTRGLLRLVNPSLGVGNANAGLVFFNNRLLAMSEDDLPYHIRITPSGDLFTAGRYDFDGQLKKSSMIAHPKLDPETGELFALSYNVINKPYLTYVRFSPAGEKLPDVTISLKQPTMIHDFAITENFVVVPDQQVVFRIHEMITGGGSPLVYDKKKVARFGVMPKHAGNETEMRWINVPGCFCFHFWNAWEENETREIVVIGSCMTPADSVFIETEGIIRSELIEIRLDLITYQSSSRRIVGCEHVNLEVGVVNKNKLGRKTRYAYLAIAEPWPKVSGFAKVDLAAGEMQKFVYGEGKYGGEPCFVPAGDEEEDDGHVLCFVHDEVAGRSELVIVKGSNLEVEATVRLPSRVPYGFHGTFISGRSLELQA